MITADDFRFSHFVFAIEVIVIAISLLFLADCKLSKLIASINVKKTFQFITMCKGDMNHHEPKKQKKSFY